MALVQWYEKYMAPDEDPELILAGIPIPPASRIAEIFHRWFDNNQAYLHALLCEKVRYGTISDSIRDKGEIATIAAVAVVLASSGHAEVDPIATAVLLVTRKYLDQLCQDGTKPDSPSGRA
jgi:hypothetical protein